MLALHLSQTEGEREHREGVDVSYQGSEVEGFTSAFAATK